MSFSLKNSESLPILYERWISELLNSSLPYEPAATCQDCAMCSVKQSELDYQFNTATKCCTLFPRIPNFLAGKILTDRDPEATTGRLRFLSQMHLITVVTPLGVWPPPAESARYGAMTGSFGHDLDLRCPYYIDENGGLCGIWKYRNSKCATFFCKHSRGQTGLHFWRALNELLRQIEETLSIWCIHKLNAGSEEFRKLFPLGPIDLEIFNEQSKFYYAISKNDSVLSRDVWGQWFGNERNFLEECSRLVGSFTWQSILNLKDSRILKAAKFLQSCFGELQDYSTPESLKLASFQSCKTNAGSIRLWGYSQYDPIEVPLEIFEQLKSFNGKSELSPDWIRKFHDFGILVPLCGAGGPPAKSQ